MIPSLHAQVGRKQYGDAVHVGQFSGNSAAAISWPAGTRTGDMAVLAKKGSAPSGWTLLAGTHPENVNVFIKSLAGSDINSPITPGVAFAGGVYREPLLLTQKATYGAQGAPGSASGVMAFAKATLCAGRLALAAGQAAYAQPTVGSPFTARASVNDGTTRWQIFDHLTTSAFTTGTGVSVTWDTTDPAGVDWAMYEFTN